VVLVRYVFFHSIEEKEEEEERKKESKIASMLCFGYSVPHASLIPAT
jgi:hypothetical protein